MDSIYPDAIDGYSQIPLIVDGVTKISGANINAIRSAIINIEKELGIKPSGAFQSVSDRINDLTEELEDINTSLSLIQSQLLEIIESINNNPESSSTVAVEKIETSEYNITPNISYVFVDFQTGGNIYLPKGVLHTNKILNIKIRKNYSENDVYIIGTDSDTIDDSSLILINTNKTSLNLFYDLEDKDWSIV